MGLDRRQVKEAKLVGRFVGAQLLLMEGRTMEEGDDGGGHWVAGVKRGRRATGGRWRRMALEERRREAWFRRVVDGCRGLGWW